MFSLFIILTLALIITDNCTTGEIRLTGGNSQYEGLVEICYNSSWRSLCPYSWNNYEVQVVCKQLGFIPIGLYGHYCNDYN